MNADLTIDIPSWMLEKLAQIASLCGKSIDYVAASFFAAEVVHTQDATGASFCARGGTHLA